MSWAKWSVTQVSQFTQLVPVGQSTQCEALPQEPQLYPPRPPFMVWSNVGVA